MHLELMGVPGNLYEGGSDKEGQPVACLQEDGCFLLI